MLTAFAIAFGVERSLLLSNDRETNVEMAYLNVRERRLETKIAYVGPSQSGKTTNFDQLGTPRPIDDDLLELAWRPRKGEADDGNAEPLKFRDCEIAVQLVTTRRMSEADVRAVVHEADGVVFVADAAPSAQTRNRETLAMVRGAIADPKKTPIIVQVNKTDLPEALSAFDVARELGCEHLPVIAASAVQNKGVVETVERSLEAILENLRAAESDGDGDGDGGADARLNGGATTTEARRPSASEGNPLLTALRQVLRDTVAEHVRELEERSLSNLDRLFSKHEKKVSGEIDQLRKSIEALRDQVEVLEVSYASGQVAQTTAMKELSADLSSRRTEIVALRDRVASEIEKQSTILSKQTAIIGAIGAIDLGSAVAPLSAKIDGLAIAPLSARVEAFEPRLREMEKTMHRQLMDGFSHVGRRIDAIEEATSTAAASSSASTEGIHTMLSAMIEELKKPKKGWFG